MLYYVYFTDGGVPKTGLSPSWEYLKTATNGTNKTGPSISEVGGGWYSFQATYGTSPWDVTAEDLVGVVDGGATLSGADRYKPAAITKRGLGLGVIMNDITSEATALTAAVVAALMADTGITAGGTWTFEKAMKVLTAWATGKWQDKSGVSGTYQILDPDDGLTVILEITPSATSPQKTVVVL